MTEKRAFTLIELLIVVAIIAILAAIAVPNFLEAQVRAKVSRAKTEMRTLDVAITAYHVDHGDYIPWRPTLIGPQNPFSWRFHRLTTPVAYITTIPKDPFAVLVEPGQTRTLGGVTSLIYDTYDYANFIPEVFDSADLRGHWWRLNSFGPDLINTWAGGRTGWVGYSPDFSLFPNYIYDPTNGSVSLGDILRVGPRCHQSKYRYDPIGQLQ